MFDKIRNCAENSLCHKLALQKIKDALMKIDPQCKKLTLTEIQIVWEIFSEENWEICRNINDNSIENFIQWIPENL